MDVIPTSELIAQQERTDAELRRRFTQIFATYRANAFLHRHDHLFLEQWTPQTAASAYQFERYEIGPEEIALYGIERANCFTYRISISFPRRLVDDPEAIDEYFRRQLNEYGAVREQIAAAAKARAEAEIAALREALKAEQEAGNKQ